MEDFDYIDALAKKALSDRTATPSTDGWNMVQQKMKRQKRKRLLIYILLFTLVCSLGVFVGIHTTTEDSEAISNNNTEQLPHNNVANDTTITSTSTSTSTSSSSSTSTSSSSSSSSSTSIVNDASQAGTETSGVTAVTESQHPTTNKMNGEKSGLVQTQTKHYSQFLLSSGTATTNTAVGSSKSDAEQQFNDVSITSFADNEEDFSLNAAGLKLDSLGLQLPELLKKKRKKKQTKKKAAKIYEQLDLMVGFNGFTRSNDYNFIGSYVVELSYTGEEKLKKNYFLKYGMSLQLRNLRFKNDSISFNKGELSVNIHSAIEKRFGNFGVEAGPYIGYELHSPNNEFFNNNSSNFFEEKINYGLFSVLHYKKVGLVFKYEFSPYINYLGDKQFGAFLIGIKYDF